MTVQRPELPITRRWIIKIGSALLTRDGAGLDQRILAPWIEQMAALRAAGREIVLVSSGSVAQGMACMGWRQRPQTLHELQAAAAIGQMGLVRAYEHGFSAHGRHTAQVLLTRDDLANRKRYLNARSTLRTLLSMGVIPVVNENDTVATDELRFGDNDTLAALVANLVEAEVLILLTDQDGLFSSNPSIDPRATLITEARVDDSGLDSAAGGSTGGLGTGGMTTKLRAARLAARSGCATIIAPGRRPGSLAAIAAGESIGTLLTPTQGPEAARKRWLAGHLTVTGRLEIDDGAVRALRERGRSLLAVGVTRVYGHFARGEVVACVDVQGREIARGLVNYDAKDAIRIKGLPSAAFESVLGYIDDEEMIHRDNLVLA
jgi:glutamate 5-kinase